MKKYIQIALFAAFYIFNSQPIFAVIEPIGVKTNPLVKSPPKLTFSQKIISKIAEKRLKKHFKSTETTETASKGDKIATFGLWVVLGSLALFLLLGLPALSTVVALRYLTLFINLTGLIACIVALTRDDLSKKGKKMAMWGVGIVSVELILFILLLILVIVALGNI